MPIDLYYSRGSAPCGAVLLAIKALNIPVNLKQIDGSKKENLTPEFLKINPQHTVPTLVDDGFSLWESRAIITYLANQYGKGSSLYPEEPKARALVDQRLYFDIGTLYQSYANYFYPQLKIGAPADSEKRTKVEDALKVLDGFLEGQKYAAGPNLTLADLALVATISAVEVTDIDLKKYSNINRWYKTVKSTAPEYEEANGKVAEAFKVIVSNALKNRK